MHSVRAAGTACARPVLPNDVPGPAGNPEGARGEVSSSREVLPAAPSLFTVPRRINVETDSRLARRRSQGGRPAVALPNATYVGHPPHQRSLPNRAAVHAWRLSIYQLLTRVASGSPRGLAQSRAEASGLVGAEEAGSFSTVLSNIGSLKTSRRPTITKTTRVPITTAKVVSRTQYHIRATLRLGRPSTVPRPARSEPTARGAATSGFSPLAREEPPPRRLLPARARSGFCQFAPGAPTRKGCRGPDGLGIETAPVTRSSPFLNGPNSMPGMSVTLASRGAAKPVTGHAQTRR